MSDKLTVRKKITYAKAVLIMRHKFFGGLLFMFPLLEATNPNMPIKTMYTDGKNIYYYKEFIEGLDKHEVVGVLLHELFHNYYKHFYRFNMKEYHGDDQKNLNMALDYAINSVILNDVKKRDNLIKLPKDTLYSEEFKGMNAEKIYNKLKQEQQKNKSKWQERVEMAKGNGSGSGQFDDHGQSGSQTNNQTKKTTAKTGKSKDQQMDEMDKKVYKIYESLDEKSKGDIPAEFTRWMDEYLENLKGWINWKKFIMSKIQEIGRTQYCSYKFNKRFIQNGLFFPGLTGSSAKIAMALDTSGSISNDDIVDFLGEMKRALTQFPGLEIILYGCDAALQGKARIKGKNGFRSKNLEKVLKGGGGTSFLPVWEDLLKTKDKDIKLLFYFTDLYGDQNQIQKTFGTIGNWRTYWVVEEDCYEQSVPFGKKIMIEKKDK